VLVAVGGDGTIGECVNGYLRKQGKEKSVALAVFPFGEDFFFGFSLCSYLLRGITRNWRRFQEIPGTAFR